ncbi:MAG: hypothetical protein IJY62_00880 [Clostridia bacterium]|nr:hypothetical protein [Clostridia bacterium]
MKNYVGAAIKVIYLSNFDVLTTSEDTNDLTQDDPFGIGGSNAGSEV